MNHFRAIGLQLFYSFPIEAEEREKLDAFLRLLESSQAWKYLNSNDEIGRPAYDQYHLFAVILLGFALGKASLREIESSCRNDLRYIYITGGSYPSYATISRFIQNVIAPNTEQIFACIIKRIFKETQLNMQTVFLDGTKQEANANKYKFVWKPLHYHQKLSDKVRSLLNTLALSKNVPTEGILSSKIIMSKLNEIQQISPENVIGGLKALNAMRNNLASYLLKAVEYEEKEAICGPNRNSYYKTDHDATAMCLKQDYYSGLGSNMHAAYSVQALVSTGFIVSYLVSQERSDLKSFQPALNAFKKMYGCYPKEVGADSGYGNLDNYEYCEIRGISAYVKYQTWNGESSGKNPAVYEYLADGSILCLGKRKGYIAEIKNRHPKKPGAVFYRVTGCTGCEFMPYCRRFMSEKNGDDKVIEVQPRFMQLKQKARDLLLSPRGIEMRVNRSCQIEGAFGNIKQNMSYIRFRRTSLERVTTEFALTCLGLNLRKYMRFVVSGKLPQFWVAPADLKPETFKKPSAKRLANRVNKKKKLQPDEAARGSYKYKRGG